MPTKRSNLIDALTEKMADPAKKDLVEEMMDRLFDFLEAEDLQELAEALDDGDPALFETVLDKVLTKRAQ